MQGSPIVRCVLALVVLLGLAGLLAGVQPHAKPALAPPQPGASAVESDRVDFSFLSTQTPARLQLSIGDQTLADIRPETTSFLAAIDVPRSGADVVVLAEWLDAADHAVKVSLSREGNPVLETSFWANASLEDVITVPPR